MMVELVRGTLDSAVVVVPSAETATVVGSALSVAGGVIALVVARINRKTALTSLQTQRKQLAAAGADAEPGVLLPARLARFVDRHDVLSYALDEIHAGERVVAIEGPVGVGKSAVATELAHRLRDGVRAPRLNLTDHTFVWVDGRGQCPTLGDICRQLTLLTGDQSLSSVAHELKLDALRAHLARHATVLLLDNVSGPDEQLCELMRTVPSRSLIIVSISGISELETATRVAVGDLEQRHAEELLEHATRRFGLEPATVFDGASTARVQAAVGGNPRAIELFAQALHDRARSVDAVLTDLERGEGVRGMFSPAWAALADDERGVLAACAGLRGQATAEQLSVACDLGSNRVAAALRVLLRAGTMTAMRAAGRPDVYLCSPALQRFVLTTIDHEAVVASMNRLSTWYVRELTREPENGEWALSHLDAIKAVLQWSADHGDDAAVQALFSSALDVLFTLGLFDDRIAAGQIAYESAMRVGNLRAASLATDVLSSTHAARGELGEAREAVALGLLAAEQSRDAGERARQLRAHGLVLYKSGDAARALETMRGADALARETGDTEILVNLQGVRTVAHLHLGELDAAEVAAREGLALCIDMGWQRATAYPLRNLAEVAAERGDVATARSLLTEARSVATTYADERQKVRIHLTAARIALVDRRLDEARDEVTAAARGARRLGLMPEMRETRALGAVIRRARRLPPVRRRSARRRPLRRTDAPIGGD